MSYPRTLPGMNPDVSVLQAGQDVHELVESKPKHGHTSSSLCLFVPLPTGLVPLLYLSDCAWRNCIPLATSPSALGNLSGPKVFVTGIRMSTNYTGPIQPSAPKANSLWGGGLLEGCLW